MTSNLYKETKIQLRLNLLYLPTGANKLIWERLAKHQTAHLPLASPANL